MIVSIDFAQASDALRISILLQTVYINAYAEDGITFEFSHFIQKRFSENYIQNSINQNPENILIASLKGNPVGVLEIEYDKFCPVNNKKLPVLSKLYVLKRFANLGIGSRLLKRFEELMHRQSVESVWLEVWVKNPLAISFYKKHGYQIQSEVDFVMEENVYQNYIMTKILNL